MNVKKGATMSLWLGAANSLIALGSAVFGVLALIRPEALKGRGNKGGILVGCGGASVRGGVGGHGGADAGLRSGAGSDDGSASVRGGAGGVEGARLYAAMYAGRAIPLGLAVSAVVWIAPNGRVTALLLGVAVAAQIADVVAAVANRLTGMAVGAASAALFHAAALAIAL